MKSKKMFQRVNLILFLICSFTILGESIVPGEQSSNQSGFVEKIIGNTYNAFKNINTKNVYPASISIDDIRNAHTNDTLKLNYAIYPDNSTFKNIEFSSSNTNIATIDKYGTIYCISEGKTVISASITNPINNKLISESISLEVTDVLPNSLSITNQLNSNVELELLENEYLPLNSSVFPDNTTNKNVNYYLSANSNDYLEIINNNVLHVKKYTSNTFDLFAYSDADNKIFTSIKVSIKRNGNPEIPLQSFSFDTSITDVYVKDKFNLNIQKSPENATNTYFIFNCDDIDVDIDQYGNVNILKKNKDYIEISAYSFANPNITYTQKYKVHNRLGYITSINASIKDDIYQLEHKRSYSVDISFYQNTTYKNVEISSSDSNIVTVYSNNTISIVGKGKCSLTIKSFDGDNEFKQVIEINVINKNFAKEIKEFSKIIRKGIGHFSLFAITAIFASFLIIYSFDKNKLLISFILCETTGAYLAFLSELFQKFTPNRTCAIVDVGIDFLGYNIFLVPIFLIYLIIYLINKKKTRI